MQELQELQDTESHNTQNVTGYCPEALQDIIVFQCAYSVTGYSVPKLYRIFCPKAHTLLQVTDSQNA